MGGLENRQAIIYSAQYLKSPFALYKLGRYHHHHYHHKPLSHQVGFTRQTSTHIFTSILRWTPIFWGKKGAKTPPRHPIVCAIFMETHCCLLVAFKVPMLYLFSKALLPLRENICKYGPEPKNRGKRKKKKLSTQTLNTKANHRGALLDHWGLFENGPNRKGSKWNLPKNENKTLVPPLTCHAFFSPYQFFKFQAIVRILLR